ncbi:MAG: SDR family oxidoreductase [Actinomycetota bacterium]|jgi:NAD(P)-dependent dehydrogenase (short-subunit alcohol dehydrogenase family)|nr:3-oxoacyl-ACP reductase [Actinomycetota bacterium]MDG1197712.1 SDR family oxidoreductase [Actinomycetota bacterium]MDG2120137.1 SDR family oxidoreductase [Actinomycetota bacterium]
MDLRLDGKVALVTGGSKGIGREIATAYAQSGAKVMITSRKADACELAALEIGNGCEWYASNVGYEDQVESLVDHTLDTFGAIDILVNNAGANPYAGPTIDVDVPRWDKTIQVNMTAPLVLTQLCWNKYMKESKGDCSIINISSVGGLTTNEQLGVYDVAKAGLIHLTKQLAAELGPKVRVNCIAPGLIKTDFAKILWDGERGAEVAASYPMGRLGQTSDIAGCATWLAAETGSWITGQTIVMDGGGLIAFKKDTE